MKRFLHLQSKYIVRWSSFQQINIKQLSSLCIPAGVSRRGREIELMYLLFSAVKCQKVGQGNVPYITQQLHPAKLSPLPIS